MPCRPLAHEALWQQLDHGAVPNNSLAARVERQIEMPRISAIVITKNEADNIAACLASVAFCDERIVVDCGSEDDTVRIAEAAGARVMFHAWEGFGAQKNFALSLAQGDWVLSIDADERVTPALKAEIEAAIASGQADGYEMPRRSTFCGRQMRYSGWYPDYVLRLFRRGRARFADRLVHEGVVCDGSVARLAEPLVHNSIPSLEDALAKIDRYSTAGAAMLVSEGRRVWFITGIARGWFAFLRTYVLQLGFLDGREGLLAAVYNAENTYYRYMKAWLATRPPRAPFES